MKFVYTAGDFTTFMGRMFAYKKATDVSDKATIAALLKRSDFKKVDDEKAQQETPPPVLKRPVITLLGKRR